MYKVINRLLLLVPFLIFISCFSSKQSKNNHDNKAVNVESKMKLSLHTEIFLKDLKKEKNGKDAENFTPSSAFIKKYGIKKKNNVFTISGFIKTNSDFNPDDLENHKIEINSDSGNIKTVTIPLNSIEEFMLLNGIDYFEINKKAKLK